MYFLAKNQMQYLPHIALTTCQKSLKNFVKIIWYGYLSAIYHLYF